MRNPWETGDTYCGIRSAFQSTDDRIGVAKHMPADRLRACLNYPGTQKTVRQFIERRLRSLENPSRKNNLRKSAD